MPHDKSHRTYELIAKRLTQTSWAAGCKHSNNKTTKTMQDARGVLKK